MDYQRLYEFRFRHHDQGERHTVWSAITDDLFVRMGRPRVVLDPAAGRGEFISSVPAMERWAIDQVPSITDLESQGIHTIVSDMFDVELPDGHFDAILLSNTLEHLMNVEDVQRCLIKMRAALLEGGGRAWAELQVLRQGVFRLCRPRPRPDRSVDPGTPLCGRVRHPVGPAPLLPYSFRGHLPPSERLTRLYLRNPWAFRLLGKQFLVIATS